MRQIFTLILVFIFISVTQAQLPRFTQKQLPKGINSRNTEQGINEAQVYVTGKAIVLKNSQLLTAPVKVVVFNSLGQAVYNGYWKGQEYTLYLNGLERGMYVVQLQQGQTSLTRKVMLE